MSTWRETAGRSAFEEQMWARAGRWAEITTGRSWRAVGLRPYRPGLLAFC
ncbi:hypothetical protein [Micromonospora sp. D75]|nr:hypothetical protein [Micromonospora sp. D75]